MKLKSNLLTVLIMLFFWFAGTTVRAQGIYNNKSANGTGTETESKQSGSGLFRDDSGPPGSGGNDGDPAPGGDDPEEPIGEGVFILSLLAGGYALVKRNIKKKHEA